jgi:hypothetical protein
MSAVELTKYPVIPFDTNNTKFNPAPIAVAFNAIFCDFLAASSKLLLPFPDPLPPAGTFFAGCLLLSSSF